MLTKLYSYLNSIQPLGEDVIGEFDRNFEFIDVSKHHLLLREGEVCDYTYIVIKGLVRMFYVKDDEEISSLFIEEKYLFNAPDSYYSRKPGYVSIETLQPTTLGRIHFDSLQRMYKQFPELNYVGRIITENYFVKSEERLYLLRKQTAEDRYTYFIEHYPSLVQKVPLKYIASYLGITTETLSRIRNKIRR